MKTVIVCFIVMFATLASFAQKNKVNSSTSKSGTIIQTFYVCPMHPEVTSSKPGKCSKCGMDLTLSKKEEMKAEVTGSYICPVHSDVASDSPGKCPKCSSKLVIDRWGGKRAATVYTCSMHPDVSSSTNGKCLVCGMQMVAKKIKKD
jgi:hypothetical protein